MHARPPDGSDGTPPAVEALRTLRILLQELEHPAPLDATTTPYACDGTRHIKGVAPTLHDGRATWISERVYLRKLELHSSSLFEFVAVRSGVRWQSRTPLHVSLGRSWAAHVPASCRARPRAPISCLECVHLRPFHPRALRASGSVHPLLVLQTTRRPRGALRTLILTISTDQSQ